MDQLHSHEMDFCWMDTVVLALFVYIVTSMDAFKSHVRHSQFQSLLLCCWFYKYLDNKECSLGIF